MKQSILFIVINGDGLGHLTRTLAVAKRLIKLNSDLEVVFYTTSLAYEIVGKHGFMCYNTPAMEQMPEKTLAREWETQILRQLERIIKRHQPCEVVFDGAYPLTSILQVFMINDVLKKLWLKREGDRPYMKAFDVYEKYFDFILVPKEVGLEYQDTQHIAVPYKKLYFAPILYIDKTESYKRQKVRLKFGLKDEDLLWYVQLGNDGTKENSQETYHVIKQLLKDKRNVILYGESIMKSPQEFKHERVITIRNYPNSVYFEGVDLAVSAAGYNTFHELLTFQIPTIFLPNKRVVKDDQVARAKRAQALGVGVALNDVNGFVGALQMIEQDPRKYRDNFEKIQFENGALQVAEYMYGLL